MKISPVKKTYEGRVVLDFPGMELEKGRIYAVVGPNGSGKSTFARILAGLIKGDSGCGLEPGLKVGYMPQKSFAFRMSLAENMMLGGRDRERAEALMKRLKIEQLAGKRAKQLSGGETARMALARLLMKSFELLILDEPTAAMDMEGSALAEELICEYCRENGCPVLLISHSIQQVRRIADVLLFFQDGRLLEYGPRDKLLAAPSRPETRRFLEFYGG